MTLAEPCTSRHALSSTDITKLKQTFLTWLHYRHFDTLPLRLQLQLMARDGCDVMVFLCIWNAFNQRPNRKCKPLTMLNDPPLSHYCVVTTLFELNGPPPHRPFISSVSISSRPRFISPPIISPVQWPPIPLATIWFELHSSVSICRIIELSIRFLHSSATTMLGAEISFNQLKQLHSCPDVPVTEGPKRS